MQVFTFATALIIALVAALEECGPDQTTCDSNIENDATLVSALLQTRSAGTKVSVLNVEDSSPKFSFLSSVAYLQESRACVSEALQEAHLQAVQRHASLLVANQRIARQSQPTDPGDEPAESASVDNHTDGGSADGGSADEPADGGSGDNSTDGGSADGGSGDKPADGGSGDNHTDGGSADGGSGDKPADGGSGDNSTDGGSADGGSGDKPADGGSGANHTDGGSANGGHDHHDHHDDHNHSDHHDGSADNGHDHHDHHDDHDHSDHHDGSADNGHDHHDHHDDHDHSDHHDGSGDKPAEGGSGDKPADGGSGDKPADGGSGDKPADGGSGDKPAGSGDKPADGGSGHKPSDGGSGDKPADGGSGDKPTASPPVVTQLKEDVSAGTKVLAIVSNVGFSIGQVIVLSQGTAIEEYNKIVGFGSLILESPLKYDHVGGATISTDSPIQASIASLDAVGFKSVTSLCCPSEMEQFFNRLLEKMEIDICSKPHIQGLMHWFSCVPDMDFQYMIDVINSGNPCKYWAPAGTDCPALSPECEGKWCR